MTQNNLDGVGKTSLLVAAMRAAESKRKTDRLFDDPFAESLAGAEGFALLNKAIEASGEQPAIAVRTAYMDERIRKALNDGIRQIVILAAGMDARAYRLEFLPGTRVFEIDREAVLNHKHRILKNAAPSCERSAIAADLTGDWPGLLTAAGFRQGERTLWMTEGLLMYLEEAQVKLLFQKINFLAGQNDVLLCDVLSATLLASPFMKSQLEFLAGLGAPWKFCTDEPETFFAAVGWAAKATQPGEFAPHRWPFPTAPRHFANVPRSFFIEALRQPENTRF